MKRQTIIRVGAILIVLSLFVSLLAGALSSMPATAAQKNVQIHNFSKTAEPDPASSSIFVDTDGDGIENNLDSDIDGDGIVNGEDPDIDGDGIENFDDADPAATTGIDSNDPQKPIRPNNAQPFANPVLVLVVILGVVSVAIFYYWRRLKSTKK